MALLRAMKISMLLYCMMSQPLNTAQGRCLSRSAKATCPTGWSKWANHCYKVIMEHLEWAQAKTKCSDIGGMMATPNSLEEQSYLWNLASREIWIDCNDIVEEGTWECKDGATDIQFRNWGDWEPDNGQSDSRGTAENCAKMWGSAWGDVGCSTTLPAVCKQPVA